jgi:hypothetical protein
MKLSLRSVLDILLLAALAPQFATPHSNARGKSDNAVLLTTSKLTPGFTNCFWNN